MNAKRTAGRAVAAVALSVACASTATAGPSMPFHEGARETTHHDVVATGLDTLTWVGLEARWMRIVHADERSSVLVGPSLELPLMLMLRGGNVLQGRVGLGAAYGLDVIGPFRVALLAETRWARAHDVMGTKVAWDAKLDLVAGLRFAAWSLGASVGVQQGLSTLVVHSGYVKRAFTDRYEDGAPDQGGGPRDGWVAFPFRRFHYGVVGSVDLGRELALHADAGLIATHHGYDAGLFDTLMYGLWPFYASVTFSARL